jgi:DNA-directed RNA polymerase specialized sigma24 family protein
VRSDSDLLAAWQGGDAAAGEELVSRHWASISRFFRAKVGDGPASADLIAQVFLACVEGKDRIAGEDVKPYLFAVARRRLAEHFRERAREPLVDVGSMSLVDLGTGVETAVDRREREALLRAALARIASSTSTRTRSAAASRAPRTASATPCSRSAPPPTKPSSPNPPSTHPHRSGVDAHSL